MQGGVSKFHLRLGKGEQTPTVFSHEISDRTFHFSRQQSGEVVCNVSTGLSFFLM